MTKDEAIRKLEKAIAHLEKADELFEDIALESYDEEYEVKPGWEGLSVIDGVLQELQYGRLQKVLGACRRWAISGNEPLGSIFHAGY